MGKIKVFTKTVHFNYKYALQLAGNNTDERFSFPNFVRTLAHEIAQALNDMDSITLHLQYVRKYKESFLRKQLKTVLSIPAHKIKKSRAALYTFLVNKNAGDGNDGH